MAGEPRAALRARGPGLWSRGWGRQPRSGGRRPRGRSPGLGRLGLGRGALFARGFGARVSLRPCGLGTPGGLRAWTDGSLCSRCR